MKPLHTKSLLAAALISASVFAGKSLNAQTTTNFFGSGANTFSLNFQTIGNAGNAADDTTGYGAVGYNYAIGTFEISQNQINTAAANGLLGVPGGAWSGDMPASAISWNQAAAFVNWLDTSTGHQAAYNLTYSGGAYSMALWQSGQAGYDPSNPYRNSLAFFVLPSEDEWYKAAYYDPNKSGGAGYWLYPTGSDTAPTSIDSGTNANTAVYYPAATPASVYQSGGLSPSGTMGQGGTVYEWVETAYSGTNTDPGAVRLARGGGYEYSSVTMQSSWRNLESLADYADSPDVGFRVAEITANAVPEPSTYALVALGGMALLIGYRRHRAV